MMASGGICCIDDFDQLGEGEQAAIHEAMSHQTITLAKAGAHVQLKTSTSVLAACSAEEDRRSEGEAALAKSLSKFDLVVHAESASGDADDEDLARHIVRSAAAGQVRSPDAAAAIADLQHHVKRAKALKPVISEEAHARLVACYAEMRRKVSWATPRHLESLIKLSDAVARAQLEEEVHVMHVEEAFEFMVRNMRSGAVAQHGLVDGGSRPSKRARHHGA